MPSRGLYEDASVQEAMAIQERMNRMLDEAFGGMDVRRRDPWNEVWRPTVDLVETPESFVFRVEVPGVAREDVEVEVDQRSLTVRGLKRFTREVDQKRYHRMECSYGRFERRFALPVDVDADGVRAELNEGVLVIRVPKQAGHVSRKIEIEG